MAEERLYFVYMPGCAVCTAVKPIVREFRDSHPDVKIVEVDITNTEWLARRWIPQVTPTFIKMDRWGRLRIFDGRPHPEGGRMIVPEEVKTWLSINFF